MIAGHRVLRFFREHSYLPRHSAAIHDSEKVMSLMDQANPLENVTPKQRIKHLPNKPDGHP